jgi:hypothetical protein
MRVDSGDIDGEPFTARCAASSLNRAEGERFVDRSRDWPVANQEGRRTLFR